METIDKEKKWQEVLDKKEKLIEMLHCTDSNNIRYLEKELYETLENHLIDYGPVEKARRFLYDVDLKYFETMRSCGERLPENFNLDYRDKVIDDFKDKLSEILTIDHISELVKTVVEQVWAAYEKELAISMLEEIKASLVVYILRCTDNLRDPQISDGTLQELYENARRRTIKERTIGSNKRDITDFYVALMNVTAWRCKNVFIEKTREFLEKVMMKK